MRDGFLTIWSTSCAAMGKTRPETKNRPIPGGFTNLRVMRKTL
jgi:hypothetical protein